MKKWKARRLHWRGKEPAWGRERNTGKGTGRGGQIRTKYNHILGKFHIKTHYFVNLCKH